MRNLMRPATDPRSRRSGSHAAGRTREGPRRRAPRALDADPTAMRDQ
ncbi:hypothetical protein ACFSM7_12570 [Clavibacter michiganensis subsp. tessellarius]